MRYLRTYYVIFTRRKRFTWWNWVLDKELYHCFAVTTGSHNSTVQIELSSGGIGIKCYDVDVVNWLDSYMSRTGNTNVIVATSGDVETQRYKGLKTCVSIMKDLLGIRTPFIITAKQLFRHLKRGEAYE